MIRLVVHWVVVLVLLAGFLCTLSLTVAGAVAVWSWVEGKIRA